MKAWGMTASIPADKCDKKCPYCISEMTGFVEANPALVDRNMEKALTWADNSQIETFIITSKREPMQNPEMVMKMASTFRRYTVEMQTNGIVLLNNPEFLNDLFANGVNNIAFSIDSLQQLRRYKELFHEVVGKNMNVRVCINLTDLIPVENTFVHIMDEILALGIARNLPVVRQVLFRNVSIPSSITSGKQYDWIKEHTSQERYWKMIHQFEIIKKLEDKKPLRVLPFDGSAVWGYKNISLVFSEYCIQESNRTDDVRSLIYLEDGHLYTSWSDPASILF